MQFAVERRNQLVECGLVSGTRPFKQVGKGGAHAPRVAFCVDVCAIMQPR